MKPLPFFDPVNDWLTEGEPKAEAGDPVADAYTARLDVNDPQARLLWRDLARVLNANVPTHVPGDPYHSAFREGQRAAFLYLWQRATTGLGG